MASRAPPIYTCDRHDRETGQPCGLSTKRKSNLDRHIRRKHPEAQPATFQPIQYLVNELGVLHQARTSTAEQTCRAPLPPAPPLPPSHSAPPLACASLNRNLDISFSCSDPSADRLLSGRPHTAISAAHSPPSSGLTSPSHDLAGPSPGRAVAQEPVPVRVADGPTALSTEPTLAITAEGPTGNVVASCVRTSTEHLAADTAGHAPAPTTSGAHASWEEHKSTTRKRLAGSLAKETLPVYGTKRSKKWPLQQRAIGWMTQAGKAHFDHHLAMLLGQWGVSQEHRGTCVLLPAAWAALDPLRLVTMFSAETCPLAFDDRMPYAYEDHGTSLTRAVAWFTDNWPRTGLELDNFLGCGPYKLRQGSHRCHHPLCVIHLIFEDPEVNEERKECHLRAKFLRREGLPVPTHCEKHEPHPCLMQHAALTTLEAFSIQFFVLLKAKGLAPRPPPTRPRWHTYPTFEHQLPLTFCPDNSAVDLVDEGIVSDAPPTSPPGKPELRCRFCPRIKSFKSIIALWSHYVHQHYSATGDAPWSKVVVAEQALLEEVRRTAQLWREYWRNHSDGGKRRDPTMMKLNQVAGDSFSWSHVLEWHLR